MDKQFLMDLLGQIIQVCLIPLLGVLTAYLVAFIRKKSAALQETTKSELTKKYLELLTETVCSCVSATNQTYVDELKKNGNFTDKAAHEEAFNKTKDAVMTILSDEAKQYLTSAFGDLNELIATKIEEEVNKK